MAKIAGSYINLDRSTARRARMDRQIAHYRLPAYARFSAIDGGALPPRPSDLSAAELGCFASHLGVLEAARDRDTCVHVMEDDAILSALVPQCARLLDSAFERFDIVFTDTFVSFELSEIAFYRHLFERGLAQYRRTGGGFEILDLGRRPLACASSYFVAPHAAAKLAAALRAEWDAGPRTPLDLVLRRLANSGALRMGCVFPFITSVQLDDIAATTITQRAGQAGNPSVLAAALIRYAFFIDGQIGAATDAPLASLGFKSPIVRDDRRLDLIMRVLAFALSDRFKPF